ncbi:hypothetical protein F5J12DRAFT_906856 [Pisolithus orientalis]|uniref:uncharacterized protein n=1 Tax=Pisolithus orientalis TaxID=936130 RepID=UPI002224CE75|nr:uncharacterized protein F5J12DRAFT_906856 [Pisolithus orientalis]KAI5998520.1 hypothetical protein F5J12DRAFT_906856 [Pisolithus orientalis]
MTTAGIVMILYHPCSRRPVLHQPYEEFGINNAASPTMVDSTPWKPFKTRGDYLFAEIALDAGLNKTQVNGLLELFLLVTKGAELTPFTKHVISAPYKGKEMEFEVHTRPVWDWALDLLTDPQLAPHFVWDAEWVYKHNGEEYERFYGEPWTCDRWWDIQSQLPADVENAIPFCFILYADKTRLSSHGTVKGYPVVVRCANLPVDIRNSESSWLPIIPEDAAEEGKLGYTTLKCVVWHESAIKLFKAMVHFSATGFQHRCWDEIIQYLFPLFLILSADYEEQCMMSLIQGQNGKAPCPICLVPLELLHDISKTFALHNAGQGEEALRVYNDCKAAGEAILKKLGLCPVPNVFWHIRYSDPHLALSFDRLHYLKIILRYLGRDAEAMVEQLTKEFPCWQKLFQFHSHPQVFYPALSILTKAACPEGYLLLGLISSYLQLDSLIGLDIQTDRTLSAIETELLVFNERLQAYKECAMNSSIPGLKVDWDFPKVHLWKHVVRDIREKGAVRNYSTRPNEKMHGPLKEAYQDHSNGRDVAGQILHVDQHILACRLLHTQVGMITTITTITTIVSSKLGFEGHCKLGSPCKPTTIQGIEVERDREDKAYLRLQRKFTDYINKFLPSIGHKLKKWVTIPADFNIYEYHYLKVNYESCFFGTPCYDCAYMQLTSTQTAFVRLITFFTCQIHSYGELQLALIQPYTASAVPRSDSMFIPLVSIIRGALLFPDPKKKDEFLVVDHVDGDMFL